MRNTLIGLSICGTIAAISFVFAVGKLPLGLVSSIEKTGPIWAGIIATIFLKEKLTIFEWVVMACSFSGIVVIGATAKPAESKDTQVFN